MKEPELDTLVQATRGLQPFRRLFHVGLGIAFATFLWAVDPPRVLALAIFGALLSFLLVTDLLRLMVPHLNVVFFRTFRVLVSPREATAIASSTWYVMGIVISLTLFPVGIVIPSVLVLALADPAAHYVGRRWGKRPLGKGTVLGTLTFVIVAFVVLRNSAPSGAALAAALMAATMELLPWKLDDNLAIPLTVATVLWLTGGG